ncbi:hypothetical protein RND81_04G156600 [Saponaria officinalis]|uniref:Uncharacterized protein n=1 Tax=Saponaria officinalis TaxID=3572 RepID=A0AAW1LMF9_SAPOF
MRSFSIDDDDHDDDDFDLKKCTSLMNKDEYKVVLTRKKKIHGKYECYDFTVISDYCPSSIFDYVNAKRGTDDLRNNARMHLSALGWKFWSKVKHGRDEWRYESPNKTYYSLMSACQAIANNHEVNTLDSENLKNLENRRDLGNLKSSKNSKNCRVLGKRKKGDYLGSAKLVSKKRKLGGRVRRSSSRLMGQNSNSNRLLRSNKCVREIGSSFDLSKNPRNVLSWMIENNVVDLRSKVYYFKKNCDDVLGEGRVFREGIRCGCCQNLYSLSGFQAHVVGHNLFRAAENVFLENGKSLVSCQVELMRSRRSFPGDAVEVVVEDETGTQSEICNDCVCSICNYGGDLILCDRCPSSFHAACLNLQGVPEGEWFCPSCCCGACGDSRFDVDALCCYQCERRYHPSCKKDRDMAIPGENWFCCKTCELIHWGLQQLLNKPFLVGHDDLTCTLVKPKQCQMEDDNDHDLVAWAEIYSKLGVALEVMHECFETVKDTQSKRDLVEDALFCRGSKLNRLNFKGFYTVLLERNDELISVAILRIYGDKVAEIPLIGTRFQHRRLGMCRILMNEIEKTLRNLGVRKLVLPAAGGVLSTWTNSFGFSIVTDSDRSEFLGYTFLDFQDTTMCQKTLTKPPSRRVCLSRDMSGVHQRRQYTEKSSSNIDHKGKSRTSEVFRGDQGDDDDNSRIATVSSDQADGQPFSTSELTYDKKFERDRSHQNLNVYKRKQDVEVELRPVSRARYKLSCTPSISVK